MKTENKYLGLYCVLSAVIVFIFVVTTWLYRDDVFQSIYDPKTPLQTAQPIAKPDYSQSTSWILRPDAALDPVNISGKSDIFVVAPTVFLGRNHWNAPIDSPSIERAFEQIVLPNYVLPFENSGRVYAPKYRQAALYSLMNARIDARDAQRLAYKDVRNAFRQFLSENPPERPIVIVGYGQGGLHAVRLLKEEMTAASRTKLAVAYIIDYPLPQDLFDGALKHYHSCSGPRDTGCVAAFGAFGPGERLRKEYYLEKLKMWNGEKLDRAGNRPLLCTNPLSWRTDGQYVPPRHHLGGVAAAGLDAGTVPAPTSQQTGAQCQDGLLLIDQPKQKSLRRPSRFGGKYRTLESNLFYEDLRVNASDRVDALIAKDVLPKRAPLMDFETIEVKDSPVTLPLKPYKQ